METVIHGFESCGLWPCNRFKIKDDECVVLDEDCEVPPDVNPSTSSQKPATEKQLMVMEADQRTQIAQENQDLTPASLTPDREQISENRNLYHAPSIIGGLEGNSTDRQKYRLQRQSQFNSDSI
ncbi:hypothetical protein KPH14_010928 [Odynerus spinipes]|uniref:Uncharacterized protein n=1 Tax=Odynerus spinipes TaxID=1348599 RepID=A0AAD9VLP4_9HYME|nr:hypothetical protein KPH14_010928 [Odynerus spinipes]